jgi:hypothetical protein
MSAAFMALCIEAQITVSYHFILHSESEYCPALSITSVNGLSQCQSAQDFAGD